MSAWPNLSRAKTLHTMSGGTKWQCGCVEAISRTSSQRLSKLPAIAGVCAANATRTPSNLIIWSWCDKLNEQMWLCIVGYQTLTPKFVGFLSCGGAKAAPPHDCVICLQSIGTTPCQSHCYFMTYGSSCWSWIGNVRTNELLNVICMCALADPPH